MTPVMRLLNQSQYYFASMSVNAELEKWFFSIIDIVAVLTESIDATGNTYKAIPYKVLKTYFLPKGMF